MFLSIPLPLSHSRRSHCLSLPRLLTLPSLYFQLFAPWTSVSETRRNFHRLPQLHMPTYHSPSSQPVCVGVFQLVCVRSGLCILSSTQAHPPALFFLHQPPPHLPYPTVDASGFLHPSTLQLESGCSCFVVLSP